MENNLKEELTTAMHSEFTVTKAIDLKHKVFTVLTISGTKNKDQIKYWAEQYQVPLVAVRKYINEFRLLQ